jgi:hypothetical protein
MIPFDSTPPRSLRRLKAPRLCHLEAEKTTITYYKLQRIDGTGTSEFNENCAGGSASQILRL